MTAPQSPVSVPRLPGYVAIDDTPLLDRIAANIRDNEALLAAVKAHHTLNTSADLMMAFSRLAAIEASEAVEIRHIRLMLGGGS